MENETIILICGLVGIVASLGVVVADILLLGRGDSFTSVPPKKRTVGFSFWRISIGTTLGVCLIPLVAIGFVPLFYALRPSGLLGSCIAVGLFGYVFGMGSGGHTFYAYNGIVHRVGEKLTCNSQCTEVLESISNDHKKVFLGMSSILLIAYLAGSLAYSCLVLTGKTHLPAWMAAINPFLFTMVAYSSYRWAPSVISGYLSPISIYVGVVPLQVLVLLHMWE